MKQKKLILLSISLICLALLGFALYLQFMRDMLPCPLCIMQRYGFAAVALICLVTAMLPQAASRVGAGLGLIAALTGGGVAGWHLWIKAHPAVSCGIDPLEPRGVAPRPEGNFVEAAWRMHAEFSRPDTGGYPPELITQILLNFARMGCQHSMTLGVSTADFGLLADAFASSYGIPREAAQTVIMAQGPRSNLIIERDRRHEIGRAHV